MSVDEAEKTQDVKLYFNCKDCDKRRENGLCKYRVYGCRSCGEKCETQTDGQKLWVECGECGMRGPNTCVHECSAWYEHHIIPSARDWRRKAVSAWELHGGMEDGVYLQFSMDGVTAVHLTFDEGNIEGNPAFYVDDPDSPELEFRYEETYFVGPVNDRVDTELFPVFAGYDCDQRDEAGRLIKECCTGEPWEDEDERE